MVKHGVYSESIKQFLKPIETNLILDVGTVLLVQITFHCLICPKKTDNEYEIVAVTDYLSSTLVVLRERYLDTAVQVQVISR